MMQDRMTWRSEGTEPVAEARVLVGQFLVSPVGWFPGARHPRADAYSFVGVSQEKDPEALGLVDGGLLFSTS